MNNLGGQGIGLWDEEDEFYYDVLHTPGGRYLPLKVRSLVGLMPLLAVETIEPQLIECHAGFQGATRMVSDQSARSRESRFALAGTRHGRAPPRRADARSSYEMSAAAHAGPGGISQRIRRPIGQQDITRIIPTC